MKTLDTEESVPLSGKYGSDVGGIMHTVDPYLTISVPAFGRVSLRHTLRSAHMHDKSAALPNSMCPEEMHQLPFSTAHEGLVVPNRSVLTATKCHNKRNLSLHRV